MLVLVKDYMKFVQHKIVALAFAVAVAGTPAATQAAIVTADNARLAAQLLLVGGATTALSLASDAMTDNAKQAQKMRVDPVVVKTQEWASVALFSAALAGAYVVHGGVSKGSISLRDVMTNVEKGILCGFLGKALKDSGILTKVEEIAGASNSKIVNKLAELFIIGWLEKNAWTMGGRDSAAKKAQAAAAQQAAIDAAREEGKTEGKAEGCAQSEELHVTRGVAVQEDAPFCATWHGVRKDIGSMARGIKGIFVRGQQDAVAQEVQEFTEEALAEPLAQEEAVA